MERLWPGIVVAVFTFLFARATEVAAIGLPENWEHAVLFIEYKRSPGEPCPPKAKFDSPDEEKAALEYCAVGTGFDGHLRPNAAFLQ